MPVLLYRKVTKKSNLCSEFQLVGFVFDTLFEIVRHKFTER